MEVITSPPVMRHIREPAHIAIEFPEKDPMFCASEVLPSPLSSPICIFLTGATGFLGKVVLEELLRRRSEYNLIKIYLLIRSKGEHNSYARFHHKIASSPCFSGLPPDWFEMVEVIEGDDTLPQCGITPKVYDFVTQHVTHVIHCAGCVSFELPILEAISANVDGTTNIHALAKASPNLIQLVATSTAYVTPHTKLPIRETLPELPYPAQEILQGLRTGKWSEAEMLTMTGHPNTYTLTKCIAEHILMEQRQIPVTVIRPSIISASIQYPSPGWIDSAAAFAGLLAGLGADVLHVLDGNPDTQLDIVPVDLVATRIINETLFQTYPSDAPSTPPSHIKFAVSTLKHTIRAGSIISEAISSFRERTGKPINCFYFGPRDWWYRYVDFRDHTVPYSLAGYYFWAMGNKKMARKTGRVSELVGTLQRVFPYFTNHTFNFVADDGGVFEEFEGRGGILRAEKGEWDGLEYVRIVCEGVDVHLLSRIGGGKV